MNGAESLLRTLVASGVDTCFMNPGTSEMHFVAALDEVPEMRGVLALFEGVATGAADGYARMSGRPAAVLLHLGPGLGNGLANLHNARKGRVPVVAIVGDHATHHKQYDSHLESDIETVARNCSSFVRRSVKTGEVGDDAAAAVAASLGPPGQVATLILPADVSWDEGGVVAEPCAKRPTGDELDAASVASAAAALRSGEPSALLVGGRACSAAGLRAAWEICQSSGARLFSETFVARLERGAGIPAPERLAYLGEMAAAQLAGLRHLVLVDAASPVSFFAYPGKPSVLVPDGCDVLTLAAADEDVETALDALRRELALSRRAEGPPAAPSAVARPQVPVGPLTAQSAGLVIGALLPEGCIVCDEANTSGVFLGAPTAAAPPHDWLMLTGGSIGIGLPLAVGASFACPGRRVLALEADGSAMYTLQALWTMARESLDVTTVIFSNRSYAVLNMELDRVGAGAPGARAKAMLELSRPDLDFVSLAAGMGVPATRATSAPELAEQLGRAMASPGPSLVEAVLPALM